MGFISPVSEPFCGDCNRIRLTAEGELRTCLFSMTETDLREPLRAGATDAELEELIRDAVWRKELKHHVNDPGVRAAAPDDVADRRMISIDEALELVLRELAPLGAERVPLADAAGRVAAEPALSAVDLPPFDRSAMDGYAVRAADTAPGVPLRLAGGVAAGEVADGDARARHGRARLDRRGDPAGRRRDPAVRARAIERDGHVAPERALAPGHARPLPRRGPARRRRCSRPPGSVLTLPRISALASAGVGEVAVHRRPRLHLIVTGSELLPLGAPPEPGRIHESNGLMVRLLAARAGAEVVDHGVIGDDREATRARGRGGPRGRRAGGVRRRLGRPARPRQARVRELRRRGGLLARADQARQAAVVRPPRRHARVRPARATRCPRSSASACSSSRRCGAWPASATPARGSSPAA